MIPRSELRIDSYGDSSGKIYPVRVTHLPTGLFADGDGGKSIEENRERAEAKLITRLPFYASSQGDEPMIPTPTPDDLARMHADTITAKLEERHRLVSMLGLWTPPVSPHEERRKADDAAVERGKLRRKYTPPVLSVKALLDMGGNGIAAWIGEFETSDSDWRAEKVGVRHFERLAGLEPIGFQPKDQVPDLEFLERVALGILDYCLAKRQVPRAETHPVCIHCGKGVTWSGKVDTDGDECQPGREYHCTCIPMKCRGGDYSGPLCYPCARREMHESNNAAKADVARARREKPAPPPPPPAEEKLNRVRITNAELMRWSIDTFCDTRWHEGGSSMLLLEISEDGELVHADHPEHHNHVECVDEPDGWEWASLDGEEVVWPLELRGSEFALWVRKS